MMKQHAILTVPTLSYLFFAYTHEILRFHMDMSDFVNIILQEKRHQSLSHSPSHGSPSDTGCINRWFKPEIDTPSSIRSIQIEEKAMKDLKRYYSSVKIVKTQQ